MCVTHRCVFDFFSFKPWFVLWVELGGLTDLYAATVTHPAVLSLHFLNRMGGGNKMKKLMGQDYPRRVSGAGGWGMGVVDSP